MGVSKSKVNRRSYEHYVVSKKLNVDESRECPICLIEFNKVDLVKGLHCSKLHIYHEECLID